MAERLNGLRERGAQASPDELVAELETAMEELRVTGRFISSALESKWQPRRDRPQ